MQSAQKFYSISEAAQQLEVSAETLRRWERSGKIKVGRTPTGNRIFTHEDILRLKRGFTPYSATLDSNYASQNVNKQPYTTLHIPLRIPKLSFKLNYRIGVFALMIFVTLLSTSLTIYTLSQYSPLPKTLGEKIETTKKQAVLGVETFIAPAVEEAQPVLRVVGGRIAGFLDIFKKGSFVVPLLGKSELATDSNLRVAGNAQIAKDIEGLGNLNIKGTAIVGKLVTGIIDPYLIENEGTVQSTLQIRSVGGISLQPGSGNIELQGSLSGIKNITSTGDISSSNLTITNNETIGGNLTLTGNLNGNTLSSTKLVFSGSSPSIYPSTSNTSISLNASGTGAINIGNSGTGDIYIAGGSGDSGCTITNSNGSLNCSSNITSQADIDVRGGDLTTNVTTFNLINATATTLNVGGASTTISIGASTGTTTVNNAATITGAATLSSTLAVTGASTFTGNLTVNGRPTFTKVPTSAHTGTFTIDSSTWNQSDAAIYINPSTATADSNLLGVAVGGNVKFDVDAEGDVFARNLVLTGNTTTGTTTVSGDLTVEGNTTLGDATTDTLTINPATLTWAGGNKTIDITGAATRTLTLLNSTVSQVADLDLSDGSLTTAGTSRLTNAGVLQNITGLTVSSGTVSLPNDQIDPSEITQGTAGQLLLSNTTPDTAWTTLSGDATLAGTGAITLSSTGVTANTYGGSTAVPVITVDAKGRLTTVTTASISSAWSSITDPTANLSLAHGANTTTFTWNAATGASTNLFTLTDTASNTGTGYLLSANTASLSTLLPFRVQARGNTIIDTTATGGVTIGNATSAQAVTVDAGTATLNVGNSNNTKTINIGTGTAADTINIGSGGTTADTITIGGLSTTAINTTGVLTHTGTGSFSSTLAVTGATTLSSTLSLGGNLTFSTDNSFDIGASGATRPRTGYFGTSIVNATGTATAPSFTFTGDTDTGFYNINANEIAITTAGVSRWAVTNAGNLTAAADNTYDIGASGASRPRDIYLGRSIGVGVAATGTSGEIQILSTGRLAVLDGATTRSLVKWSGAATQVQIGDATGVLSAQILPATVMFQNIGTTASAANAFLDSGNNNSILRSTSSLRYKNLIGDLSLSEAQNIILNAEPIVYTSKSKADNPNTIYVGFAAEQIATVDARFITYDEQGLPNWVQYPVFTAPLTLIAQNHEGRLIDLESSNKKLLSVVGIPALTASSSATPVPSSTPTATSSAQALNDLNHLSGSILSRLDLLEKSILSSSTSLSASASVSALLDLSHSDVLENTRTTEISGALTVLGRTVLSDLGITGKITNGLLAINGLDCSDCSIAGNFASINTLSNDLYLQNLHLGGVNILNGKVTIDKDGNLSSTSTITAKNFAVSGDSTGKATLAANQTDVEVISSFANENSKIFVTSETKTGGHPLNVTSRTSGKFTVSIEQSYSSDITFDYWIIN